MTDKSINASTGLETAQSGSNRPQYKFNSPCSCQICNSIRAFLVKNGYASGVNPTHGLETAV